MGSSKNKKRHRSSSSSDSDSSRSSNDSGRDKKKMSRHRERSRSREQNRRESDRDRRSGGYSRSSRDFDQKKDRKRYDNYNSRDRSDNYNSRDRSDNYNSRDRSDNRRDNFQNRNRRDRDNRRHRSRSRSFDHGNAKWGKNDRGEGKDVTKEVKEKEKPNFALSGKLTEETNTYRGVVIKYSEPPEARKPRRRWRLYPFKGEKALQTLYIHRESGYLIGRDRKVVDLPVDHPSCSKQHAALQYRLVPFTRDDGSAGKRVRPYLIDLESANGTFINNKKIESRKYVELLERDVIKFGFSSREYVLLHENSKDEAMDDDVKQEEEDLKEEVEVKGETQ